MEFGVGIHGEPGIAAAPSLPLIKPSMKCSTPCWKWLIPSHFAFLGLSTRQLAGEQQTKQPLQSGDRVIALVNILAQLRFLSCTASITA